MTTEQSPPTTLSEERLEELKNLWIEVQRNKEKGFLPNADTYEFERLCVQNGAALLNAAEQIARYQWQPIESAPKDGTEILLLERGQVIHARWGGDFHNTWVHARTLGFCDHPTHWMHLPPAPEKQEGGVA